MRKTLAVVLRTVDFKDNDRMITFLTKDYGLMSAKVRGAKKQTSKLFFGATLFCCGEYGFFEKNGFFGVKSCDIKYSFSHLQKDFDVYAAACFVADAAGKVAQEDFEAVKLFALVVNTLYALDKGQVAPLDAVCYYVQRLLYIEGLYPSLDHCVFCGSGSSLKKFSAEHGGVVCGACAPGHEGINIDDAFLRSMKDMQGILPKDIAKVEISQGTHKQLTKALVFYLEHTLQKPLKSSKFVKDACLS